MPIHTRFLPVDERTLDEINRILEDKGVDVTATIGTSLVMVYILAKVEDRNVEAMDAIIDDLASLLKRACRTGADRIVSLVLQQQLH